MSDENTAIEVIEVAKEEVNPEIAKKISRSNIPSSDIDLVALAHNVAETWKERGLTLDWLSADDFIIIITNFENSIDQKISVSANRNPITARLRELNAEIDKKIEQVKYYLAEKYDSRRDAVAHYAKFGISKQRSSYKLPYDQESRLKALKQLIDALEKESFTEKTFGTIFWTKIYTEYKELIESVTNNISNASSHVGIKKEMRKQIKKTLNSLIHLIKANYPTSFKTELRVWGFQKEKY